MLRKTLGVINRICFELWHLSTRADNRKQEWGGRIGGLGAKRKEFSFWAEVWPIWSMRQGQPSHECMLGICKCPDVGTVSYIMWCLLFSGLAPGSHSVQTLHQGWSLHDCWNPFPNSDIDRTNRKTGLAAFLLLPFCIPSSCPVLAQEPIWPSSCPKDSPDSQSGTETFPSWWCLTPLDDLCGAARWQVCLLNTLCSHFLIPPTLTLAVILQNAISVPSFLDHPTPRDLFSS